MNTHIETITFSSTNSGPKILVLGCVHGNEKCGYYAITKLIEEVRSGKHKIENGSVTFVPICNPAAFAKNRPYIKENLNRIFKKHTVADSDEKKFANILTRLVDSHDVVLDLHSITSAGKPFIFLDYKGQMPLAKIIGLRNAVTGWTEAYAKQSAKSSDSIKYSWSKGKECILVECGQHNDPKAKDVAYKAIINVLAYKKIITKPAVKEIELDVVELQKIYFKKEANGAFAKKWEHLERVKKGARITDGRDPYTAPNDGYILLPSPQATVGEEWFYLGRKL